MEPKIASSDSLGASLREGRRGNWIPLSVAAGLVIVVVVTAFLIDARRQQRTAANFASAQPDPYSASLPITNLAMSEASNLAGGKVTYVDGHIANTGNKTVTGILVRAIFRDYAHKIAQNQTVPLAVVRMREPYIDTVPVSAAPLKPGSEQDFRLNFDTVSPDWAGVLPEVSVVHVDFK